MKHFGPSAKADSGYKNGKGSSDARLAYERLLREVIDCDLPPGERLTEASVAQRLGLGKTPAREALHRLILEGLVVVSPRDGYYVAPITIRDVDEVFQLRKIIEAAAAKMAAGNTKLSHARLKKLGAMRCRATDRDSLRGFVRANTAFHLEIANLSGNRQMAHVIAQLLAASERLVNFGMMRRPQQSEGTLVQHRKLTAAIVKGDGDLAARIAEDHIETTHRMIIDGLVSNRLRETPISASFLLARDSSSAV
jgi:DNA-binding GntR family transcriptional regulator